MAPDKNEGQESQPKQGRMSLKVAIIVLTVMLLEAVAIIGTAMITSTPEVGAEQFQVDEEARNNEPVEILLIEGRFPNNKTGVTYFYDTQIMIEVKRRHEAHVQSQIEASAGRISATVMTIFRNAEPRHFNEPHLQTLSRQIHEAADQILGEEAATGEPYLEKIFITRLMPFRSD